MLNSWKDIKFMIYLKICACFLQLTVVLKVSKASDYWFSNPVQLILKTEPFVKCLVTLRTMLGTLSYSTSLKLSTVDQERNYYPNLLRGNELIFPSCMLTLKTEMSTK